MVKRCVMIFPHFDNIKIIDDIRRKYDPLAEHVRPHITLVFPFESDIETDKLEEHIEAVISDIKPFSINLSGITPSKSFGNYLFLNIKNGYNNIVLMHKRIYTGILEEFYPVWLKNAEFMPHMTVGNISDIKEFSKAVVETSSIDEVFEATVHTISVEIIGENEDSIIELNIPLGENYIE